MRGITHRYVTGMNAVFIGRYLMIKSKFAGLVLSGEKTTTIRLGRVVPKSREVIIHSGGRPIAEAKIKNTVYKKVGELTEEDARRDGYASLRELLNDLERMYGRSIAPENTVTIIEFEVVRKFDSIDASDVYLGFSPYTLALLANRYLKDLLNEDEKAIVEGLLRYRSIRVASVKLFGTLQKRWIIRKTLRRILVRLVDKGLIKVDEDLLKGLASISVFWKRYLLQKKRNELESVGDPGEGNAGERR